MGIARGGWIGVRGPIPTLQRMLATAMAECRLRLRSTQMTNLPAAFSPIKPLALPRISPRNLGDLHR